MVEKSQLTEIQDEADLGTEIPPMNRCLGLNCSERVPHGEHFCQVCLKKKNSTRTKDVSNGSNSHRVLRGTTSSREV